MSHDEGLSPEEAAMYERATSWFYRTRIKDPKDSVEQIAQEAGLPVADVTAWIAEAERVLSIEPSPEQMAEIQRELVRRLSGDQHHPLHGILTRETWKH